ncbi:MAG: calcium/sodium antiporter [Prolixibacteraceae bacterium]|jgi:cation:H+ antiporter|nr:calcium/sodium antiporter [Prolixibacteraceae bacterium]MDD4755446.1 calcium/sodium antiporter [Prolixibacteraceae bacterium]NLO03225.1 calcium/sodium antiporter [Bacteroidales bacterium]
MILQIIWLAVGFTLLIKSADWLVDGASALAKKYNVSDLAIGLTVVSFGTSAPELVVNTIASYQNHQDLVFGNVIGSNNLNLFVVLGIAGIITPLIVQSSTVWKEIPISFFGIVFLFFIANDFFFSDHQVVSRIDGFLLLSMFILFLYYVYKQMKTDPASQVIDKNRSSIYLILLLIIAGLAGLVIGGRLVINNAVKLATSLGVSEKIIGLTIVAIGTSLPELATSVIAALRKNNDIAVGNIIGSNIFNIFFILGVSALVRPVGYHTSFNFDFYLLAAGTIILFIAMFTGKKKKLDRWEAAILVLMYVVYTTWLIKNEISLPG